MTTKNNPAPAAFTALAKEFKGHGSRMAKLVKPLAEIGMTRADISRDGKYYDELKDAVARVYLTPAQYKVFADKTLTQAEGSPRRELAGRVSSSVGKVRDAILKAMEAPAARGARGKNKTPTEAFFDSLVKYVDRFSKEDASDKFDFDPKLARQRLVALVKELK